MTARPAQTRADRAETLAAAGRADEAAALLVEGAAREEPDALYALAVWRIEGTIVRRDLAAARALLARAEVAGHPRAGAILTGFLASGTGGPADWRGALARLEADPNAAAAAQRALIAAMTLDERGFPRARPAAEPLSAQPRAWRARGFLSAAECAYLRDAAEPWLQPSVVVDPATGRMVPNPIRTSDGAAFGVTMEDAAVAAINRRIAALSGTPYANGEPLQLLRYRPGAEYKTHLDALPPGSGNQRILTVIVYLSDDYEGGETVFPRAGLTVRGRAGDALMFANVLPDGTADPSSIHAGLPVRSGVKAIATRWIREQAFTFPPPVPATGDRFG